MRSQEELSDKLAADRVWRIKEISAVRGLAARPGLSLIEKEFYCRSSAALFYAHWEGYTKRAATYYLKFVSLQRIPLADMSKFVLRLYMRQKLATLDGGPEKIDDLAGILRDPGALCPAIQWKDRVQTQSNLSSTVLKKICETVGVDYKLFALKAKFIDEVILKNRNAIAHGDKGEVNLATLEEIGETVTALITTWRDAIENAAALKLYIAT